VPLSPDARARLLADPELATYVVELEDLGEAFQLAPMGLALYGADGCVQRANAALCEMLGRAQRELVGLHWADFTHEADVAVCQGLIERALSGELNGFHVQKRYVRKDGSFMWGTMNVSLLRDIAGVPRTFVVQVEDISERRRLEADLRHAADHDPLTGLPNRRRLMRELDHQIARCERYGDQAALVLLDLDYLKQVNDTHGHPAGDALLVRVAHALAGRLRSSDVLARVGGDELAALLVHIGPEEALAVAVELVETARTVDGSLSAGVATIGPDCQGADAVIAIADRALYAAKRAGRDRAMLGR
jgi:diguanylate cyclase (GGDEF)-like protein/PAS domain S-box-containing protein